MFDMIVAQSKGGATPLTPSQAHLHPTDLSPRSSGSSSLLSNSPSPTSAKDLSHHQLLQALHGNGVEDLSPLQRLQFAIERNSLFSNLFNGHEEGRGRAELHSPNNNRHEKQNSVQTTTAVARFSSKKAHVPEPHYVQSPVGSPNSDPANIFQCPLCSIVCNGRHSFNEHLVTHTQHHACPKCDYLTSSEEKLRDHLQEIHELTDPDLEDPESSVPKVNSQGKVKTFKCKQCEHVSVTKSEFWAHSKSHIRSEKMLNCPKCSFVTEYKHHLEYHLRNHFGSKPFICTKCPYTCVNKSMLNSHLKSHSNIYQYRCADCSYATKYCHSLKLHLRKYNHNPSMVLNPDGTPNPLPIIDVYGTRRGPKMKRPPTQAETPNGKSPPDYAPVNSNGSSSSSFMEDSEELPVSNSPAQKRSHAEPILATPPLKRFTSDTSDSDNEIRRSMKAEVPMSPITPVQQNMDQTKAVFEMAAKNPLELYAAALNQYLYANPLLHLGPGQASMAQEHQGQLLSHFLNHQANPSPMLSGMAQSQRQFNAQAPLDLRQLGKHEQTQNEDLKRRKRKGKALRHEKYQNEVYQEESEALDFSSTHQRAEEVQSPSPMMCKYCEISFPDKVLYSMHMSYHSGDRDPFHCKSCGKKTQDKVSFFLHLTTDSH